MADDLDLARRRRKEKFRRQEEERRQQQRPVARSNDEAKSKPKPAYSDEKLAAKPPVVAALSLSSALPLPSSPARKRAPSKEVPRPAFSRPTFWRAAPPKEVLSSDSAASPASSVSFSQSPGKAKAVTVTFARETAVKKQKPAYTLPLPPPPPARKQLGSTLYRRFGAADSSSSDEEDFDPVAFLREAQDARKASSTRGRVGPCRGYYCYYYYYYYTKKKKKKKKKDTTSSSVGVREGAAVESNSQIIQKGNNNGNGNNKNDDDKGSSGTPTPTKPDKPSTPRNPLARMKENSKPVVRASPPVIAGADTSLWSDDDEDQADQAAATATATAGASQDKRKIPVLEKRKKKRRPADTTNKARQDWSTSNVSVPNVKDVSGKDTAALQAELMPDFERPKFGPFALEPLKLLVPSDVSPDGSIEDEQGDDEDSKKKVVQVPASINRFLPNFQQEGIGFVYKVISSKRGAILGDDMGVGKTVQIVSLLAALFHKTGTGSDLLRIQHRQKVAAARAVEITSEKDAALLAGRVWKESMAGNAVEAGLSQWAPVLIVVPPSIIQNWVHDFSTWGHFSIAVYQGSQSGREKALESIRLGVAEVMICAKCLFTQQSAFSDLYQIKWKLIIVDEFHQFKNKKGVMAEHLRCIRDEHSALVVGLTGTLMQNSHDELWNLIDLVAKNYLGTWEEFEQDISIPIKLARAKDANAFAVELGDMKARELSNKLHSLYIRRTKEDVLKDALPMKDERIVFCEPSELQKTIYQHILEQPDFVLLSQANGPCECGVNQKFFLEYQHLPTKEQRIEYQRRNKDQIVKRAKCCHSTPVIPGVGIDPRAVLWRQYKEHEALEQCIKCPYCICFATLHILYKLSSHVGLLQLPAPPSSYKVGSPAHTKALNNLERAKVFLPLDILPQLPGGSYIREGSIMDDHFSLSGKFKVMGKLLRAINSQQGRVLLFSASTQTLDLIQNFVKSEGYS